MPLSDQTRIARESLNPRIVALCRALTPLQTIVSFMNTGAHPDDETSAMLAALRFRDGIDISYACSTRGEGGQNDIGTEGAEALGVLRTAEMERAADVLDLRLYWLSETPDDSIFDFGFSKSGVETLNKWGRERTLKRFVDILRMEKPDIICPTFLDIPGQHGHHRAMTEAAHQVMALCGDLAYTDSPHPPWHVKKLYLPAWSGAGQAYDDDMPPPPPTLTIEADGVDPVTGFSFERIGQQSRAFHLTQAMGSWVPAGSERNWPLHLAESRVEGPDLELFSGLPRTLRDLGGDALAEAQHNMDAAVAAFPDFGSVLKHASLALVAVNRAEPAPEYAHKIRRKREQLSRAIRIAAGAEARARLKKDHLYQTDETQLQVELRKGAADTAETALTLPDGWKQDDLNLTLSDADISDPYPTVYLPDAPRAPSLSLKLKTYGVASQSSLPLEVPPLVLPASPVELAPMKDILNLRSPRRDFELAIGKTSSEEVSPTLSLPSGWHAIRSNGGYTVTLPRKVAPGSYTLPLSLNGVPARTVDVVAYDHADPRAMTRVAKVQLEVIDVALPKVKIGYTGGGNDRVDHWLTRMGFDVTRLTNEDLQSDARMAEFDTVLIGIFAMKFREGLAAQMPRLHDWCAAGGTLITLYHRPWDNWDEYTVPPRPLEIGQPSFRWRVTDENSEVTHLSNHTVLTTPNLISEEDWTGWHKERGLYFAKSWAPEYIPLLKMADLDEVPQKGALLVADIGKGRHIHCALILHHQMENLVPGAFRIMANLLAKRS